MIGRDQNSPIEIPYDLESATVQARWRALGGRLVLDLSLLHQSKQSAIACIPSAIINYNCSVAHSSLYGGFQGAPGGCWAHARDLRPLILSTMFACRSTGDYSSMIAISAALHKNNGRTLPGARPQPLQSIVNIPLCLPLALPPSTIKASKDSMAIKVLHLVLVIHHCTPDSTPSARTK